MSRIEYTAPELYSPPRVEMTRSINACLLISLVTLAACDRHPTPPADTPPVAQAEVNGTVSYRERIPLPPGAGLRIVIEDINRPDVPVTIVVEDVPIPDGEQVPIAFKIGYDRSAIVAAHAYGLSARIVDKDGVLLWATDRAHPVIAQGADSENLRLELVRVPRSAASTTARGRLGSVRTAVFDCIDLASGDFSFVIRTGPGEIAVWLPLRFGLPYLVLGQVAAASGAKYVGDGVIVWTHADEALLDVDGEQYSGCELNRANSIWEDAKLSGVDFRATGNEPGWQLEIRDGESVKFVYDYGQSQVSAPAPAPQVEPEARQATYDIQTDTHMLTVRIHGIPCIDSMSGEQFESSVVVDLNGKTFQGCGRALH